MSIEYVESREKFSDQCSSSACVSSWDMYTASYKVGKIFSPRFFLNYKVLSV